MRNFSLLFLLAAASVYSQVKPRATVDGKPVSQAELEALSNLVPEQARAALVGNEDELLRYYGFVMRMAALAEKAKLAEQSPYKEQIELGRTTVLAIAEMAEYNKGIVIPLEEVQKYYEQHKDEFTTVNVTAMQVPVGADGRIDAAKTKAETLWKQIQGGAKFDTVAKPYLLEGFHSFLKSDTKIPADVKEAVSALKPGGVSKPVVTNNGVYIFRLESVVAKPFQDARGDVLKTMQDDQYQKWMDGIRKSVVIGK